MSRKKVFYDKQKAAGLCVRCSIPYNPALPGKTMCQECIDNNVVKMSEWIAHLRSDMMSAYGAVCAHCGTDEDLNFHHINDDGAEHRKTFGGNPQGGGYAPWHDLRKRGFPPIMQTLCLWCHKEVHGQRVAIRYPLTFDRAAAQRRK